MNVGFDKSSFGHNDFVWWQMNPKRQPASDIWSRIIMMTSVECCERLLFPNFISVYSQLSVESLNFSGAIGPLGIHPRSISNFYTVKVTCKKSKKERNIFYKYQYQYDFSDGEDREM